jgi:hypothetical protein
MKRKVLIAIVTMGLIGNSVDTVYAMENKENNVTVEYIKEKPNISYSNIFAVSTNISATNGKVISSVRVRNRQKATTIITIKLKEKSGRSWKQVKAWKTIYTGKNNITCKKVYTGKKGKVYCFQYEVGVGKDKINGVSNCVKVQ